MYGNPITKLTNSIYKHFVESDKRPLTALSLTLHKIFHTQLDFSISSNCTLLSDLSQQRKWARVTRWESRETECSLRDLT